MDWKILGVVFALSVLCIAMFLEMYKKIIRKDRAKNWECMVVALVFSVGLTMVAYGGLSHENIHWPLCFLYGGIMFACQFTLDMLFIKKLGKAIGKALLKQKGVNIDGFNWNE